MKKIIAFDFDGTLAPSFPLIVDCFIKSLSGFGIKMTSDELRPYYGPNEKGMLKKFLGEEKGKQAFKEYCSIYSAEHYKFIPSLDPVLFNLLLELKDVKGLHLVLLTGRSEETWKISCSKLGLDAIFEKVYTGAEGGVNKPDSINECLNDFKADKSDFLYIGDSLKDIESCGLVGVDLLSVSYFNSEKVEALKERNPGNVLNTPAELKSRIESILELSD